MKILVLIFFAILAPCACAEWKSYSYNKIVFDESGYPDAITITLHSKDIKFASKLVYRAFITKEQIIYDGVTEPTPIYLNGDFIGIQITISTDVFRGSKFIDSDKPTEWEMSKISGRKISIENNNIVIPFIKSKDYIVGITFDILDEKGEEILKRLSEKLE